MYTLYFFLFPFFKSITFVNIVTYPPTITESLGTKNKIPTQTKKKNINVTKEVNITKNFLEARWFSSSNACFILSEAPGGAFPYSRKATADFNIVSIAPNIA